MSHSVRLASQRSSPRTASARRTMPSPSVRQRKAATRTVSILLCCALARGKKANYNAAVTRAEAVLGARLTVRWFGDPPPPPPPRAHTYTELHVLKGARSCDSMDVSIGTKQQLWQRLDQCPNPAFDRCVIQRDIFPTCTRRGGALVEWRVCTLS